MKGVGREFILWCQRLDLSGGELLAIDPSEFRAVNGGDRSYTASRLEKLLKDTAATIACLSRLDVHDQREATVTTPSADALREKIAASQLRAAVVRDVQTITTAASGETARSLTDPDSRPRLSGGRIEARHNVETAVDARHTRIVADDDTNAATDRDQLSPLATTAQ